MSGDGAVSEFDSDERVRRHSGQDGAIGGLSDTALAVVVGTLTLVGVVGFFQSGSSGAKTNSEIANLTALVGSIRAAYYQAGSDYSGITSAILASSKIAPAPLIRGANLTSMFGGAITVASATSNSQFTVQYAGIPVDACIKILTNVWVNMSDVIATSVNGAAATTFTMAGATTACGQSSNSILFTFQ
jgi:hypothetical protein